MRIDIAAEIKFSHVAEGEYLVLLQDADQTIIGKLLRADGGWKSYAIEPDRSWKGSFHSFGNTRYEASRSLLEAYELANGLRDSEGRRVMKELETNLWYVADFRGVRESSRWADKAEAIAKLASLHPVDWEAVGRQAAFDGKPAAPAVNQDVRYALAGSEVGDPENVRIMGAFSRGYQAVRDQQAAEVLTSTDELPSPVTADDVLTNFGTDLGTDRSDYVTEQVSLWLQTDGDYIEDARRAAAAGTANFAAWARIVITTSVKSSAPWQVKQELAPNDWARIDWAEIARDIAE